MGFYLWVAEDLAWAQGTYEYRPMGTAVVAVSDLFTRRDFDPRRKTRPPATARYLGQYASLGHVNIALKLNRNRYRASAEARPGSPSRA
jgi:hypothetical protein